MVEEQAAEAIVAEAPVVPAAPKSDLATPVMVARPNAETGAQGVTITDAQAQILCSLDNPDDCEACGS
jgi:hypothetical protein